MKTKRQKNFFKDGFESSWKYIKDSKKFIYIICAIFLLFIVIGYVLPAPDFIEQWISEFIENLLKKTTGMSWLDLTVFIFLNNLQSSFFGMIFGTLLGIFSIIAAIINGYLLGFVSSKVVEAQGVSMLWRLLPHGIFELPAFLISMGIGLKIGTFIFYKKKKDSFKRLFVSSLKAFFFFIIPLLIIAALIESTLIVFFG